jgi:hypothetical protein
LLENEVGESMKEYYKFSELALLMENIKKTTDNQGGTYSLHLFESDKPKVIC